MSDAENYRGHAQAERGGARADDRKAMFERYAAQPNPLAGKDVIGVLV